MANEISYPRSNSDTLYALVTRADKYIYDVGDTAFEAVGTWNDARIGECDIAMTPTGDNHYADFPSVAAGVYKVEIRLQAGASPDTDDKIIGVGEMCWDGSAEITRSALDTLIDTVKAETALIVEDTNELQGNQGNWATATGFATPTDVTNAHTTTDGKIDGLNNLSSANVQSACDAAVTANTKVVAIEADTNELQAELADGGRTDALIDVIDGIVDDIKSYLVEGGRIDVLIDTVIATVNHADYGNAKLVRATTPANTLDIDAEGRVDVGLIEGADATDTINGSVSGPGDHAVTITVKTTGEVAVGGVCVWLNTSNTRSGSVVKAAYTNDSGEVTFNLNYDTTYYIFCHLAGYSFANAYITPASGSVTFTKNIGTVTTAGSDSDYDSSFLTRSIAQVREALDEPELNAKYSNTAIIRHLELAYPIILGEINRNSKTPVVAKYTVTITDGVSQYVLPPTIGSVYAIYQEMDTGAKVFYDSRSRYNPRGRNVWLEGNVLNIQTAGGYSVGTEIVVEYVPSGVAKFHNGTCTLDADGDTVTVGSSPHVGSLDTRDNVYAGCIFRVIKADGTGDYVQERTIASYDRTGPTMELDVALDPVPTGGDGSIYYEVAPTIYKGLDLVIPMYAAYAIASFEGRTTRAKNIRNMYRDHVRNLRLAAYYSNLQDATKVHGDTYNNRRYRRY